MKRQNGKAQRTDIPGSEWDMPAEVGPEATRELTVGSARRLEIQNGC